MEFKNIEKSWISSAQKGHNFILFNDQILYKRKVKIEDISEVKQKLFLGKIDDKFIGLPMSYIRKIEFREDDSELKISYGEDSEDSFDIPDHELRKEVFEYLSAHTKVKERTVKRPSILSRIKKPLIAFLVVAAIFTYVYTIINGLNQGYEYELIPGRRGPGLAGVVLMLAQLGLIKNILIFSPLALIAIYRMYLNFKNNSEVYCLKYHK